MPSVLRLWASLFALGLCAGAQPAFQGGPAASVLVCGGSMMNGDRFADSVVPAMREHYAGCRNVVLVLHASHPSERDRMEERLRKAFDRLAGIPARSLHTADREGRRRMLKEADGIFVGGGETFVLLAELVRSGELALIRERVLAGVRYGGSSAGANVAGLVIGTTNDFPVTPVVNLDALALFPATINPHHPAAQNKAEHDGRVGKIKAYLRFNPDMTVLGLANASIARLHAGQVTLMCGEGWLYRSDAMRPLKPGEAVPELASAAR